MVEKERKNKEQKTKGKQNMQQEKEKQEKQEKKQESTNPIKLIGIKDSKSDFVRYFVFYLSIILVLFAITYILSILPNLLVKSSQPIQTQNNSLSNLQNLGNPGQQSSSSNRVCNVSMTQNSKLYNVKYNIKYKLDYESMSNIQSNNQNLSQKLSNQNDSYIDGYIEFRTARNKGDANQGSNQGYTREIIYYINYSKLFNQLNKSLESLSEIRMNYTYDSNFVCKNGSYSFSLNGQSYTESLDCIPPDIPFQICKENLKEMKSYELNLSSGSYNVTEYLLKAETDVNSIQSISNPSLTPSTSTLSQDVYLTFSDLPFPITMNSSDSYMELVSYSKIE